MPERHLITSEYPPQAGGISDYSSLVAAGLAAKGESVHVWCPFSLGKPPVAVGVTVHQEFGRFTPADLRRVGKLLDQFPAPRRLLVQWVPHGYGYQSMNLPFCLWLWSRAKLSKDKVEIMVHEPYLAFRDGTWKQNVVAVLHRLMTIVLLNSARYIWISIPAWEKSLRPYTLGRQLQFTWLPVFSNVPVISDPVGVKSLRTRFAPNGELVIGHFGTYGQQIYELLISIVPLLMSNYSNRVLLFLGRGSGRLRDELARKYPDIAGRFHASGSLCATDLSRHVSACDVMIQPYPDGISSRRTSAMVGLSHGLPIITTSGHLTEPIWSKSRAVAIAQVRDSGAFVNLTQQLLEDSSERLRLSLAARELYINYFNIKHSIEALMKEDISAPSHLSR
jgi:glycosyltransferase involved in cell wall biosynthesis